MARTIKWAILAFLLGSLGGYLSLYVARPVLVPELETLRARCEDVPGEGSFRSFDAESCSTYSNMMLAHSRSITLYGLGLGLLAALGVLAFSSLRSRDEEESRTPEPARPPRHTRAFVQAPEDPPPPAIGRRLTPVDLYSDPNSSGRVRIEDRNDAMKPRDGFGRERWAEPQLVEKIAQEPNNLAARMDLMDLYLEADRKQEAAKAARDVVKLLVTINEHNRAYDVYRRVRARLGHLDLGIRSLAGLLDQRLTMRDAETALELFENLYGQDPNFNRIPELLARLVRLLASHHGAQSPLAKHWYGELIQRFAGTRETEDLILEFAQDGGKEMSTSPDIVRTMIANHQYSQAVNTLMADTALVSQIDLLDLYPVAQRLAQDRSLLPKAVMLMELMIRNHLEHPGAPALVLDLIDLYLTRLNQRQRAEKWGGYLLSRWPKSQEAARVREILPSLLDAT